MASSYGASSRPPRVPQGQQATKTNSFKERADTYKTLEDVLDFSLRRKIMIDGLKLTGESVCFLPIPGECTFLIKRLFIYAILMDFQWMEGGSWTVVGDGQDTRW